MGMTATILGENQEENPFENGLRAAYERELKMKQQK